ncbi:MAG: prephenate dehydrogenase/arogenate dehydrogenase family protein [Aquificae bacterium]|nr:prephenate dehydrogenase/arogenate dehydrogenase family protein [Aquificota bacterium]
MSKDFGNFDSILIIGLGLIGGSLALSLKEEGFTGTIYGYDLSKERIQTAQELNAIDKGFSKLEEIPWDKIDLVILATPVRTFEKIAKQIKPFLNSSTVVSDVGSVKGDLIENLSNILKPNTFIGIHPIAGTEKEGIENAVVGLFKGAKVIITPTKESKDAQRLKKLWEDLGSKVEVMNPHTHDFVFASVSHLPHAVAFALVDALIKLSKETGIDLFSYPGGGFKDFTRIAASSPTVWKDIFIENKKDVIHAIDEFTKSLQELKKYIQEENQEKLIELLSESREKRLSLDKS